MTANIGYKVFYFVTNYVVIHFNQKGQIMNCADAQAVWNHKGGLIAGLNCGGHGYQAVLPHLTQLAAAFKEKLSDPFDTSVKKKAGDGAYRVTHSDGESDLAKRIHDVIGDEAACNIVSKTIGQVVGLPNLRFANICCNGCKVSDGFLDEELNFRIQMAAVNTHPDGSTIT